MRSKSFLCVFSFLAALAVPAFGTISTTPNKSSINDRKYQKSFTSLRAEGPEGATADAPVDFNGDGRSDWAIIRNTGGIYNWFIATNGGSPQSTVSWGVSGDRLVNGDFDGDNRDDIAVFRPSNATFYILNSQSSTVRIDNFGQNGDDPTVVGDYNDDGIDDVAVYREGTPSTWFFKTAQNAFYIAANWGQTGDFVAPGDYDGDGRYDFAIQRPTGADGVFWVYLTGSGGVIIQTFGASSDLVVPGDYDGDRKTDFATVRNVSNVFLWNYKPSASPATPFVSRTWGVTNDVTAQGDYDGDGATDFCVWRPGSPGIFYVSTSASGAVFTQNWGVTGDIPVARFNAH